MAKRVRGSRAKTGRSAGQAPARQGRAPDTSYSGALSGGAAPDIDAAIDTLYYEEAELTLAEAPPAPTPRAPRSTRRESRVKADSLAARMAAEDVYVREDLRRIAIVSAVLFALLGLAWFVFAFLDVLGIY